MPSTISVSDNVIILRCPKKPSLEGQGGTVLSIKTISDKEYAKVEIEGERKPHFFAITDLRKSRNQWL